MRNLALETPRLQLRSFVKRSVNKIRGFWGVPKLTNLALEAPRLELRGFVKRCVNKIRGF